MILAGGGDINFDNYFYGRRAAKNWGELTVGGDVKLKDNWRIYGEVSKYLGDIRNSINYELGAKLTF
ncbi:MAG: autotransporter outer membrane beta-barrel domain-containing protein [Acidaminococcaceae bacterium]|jgi:outer membrane autotransporter protein|nr:autotransporter outer membrane beta-barrel domain-containing protein [Acidaminococcaceae bacterium]